MNLTAKYLAPALIAMSLASPLHADDKNVPVVLEPKGAWNIDFAEDKCRLARAFGSQENLHILFFELSGPGAAPGMTFAGPAIHQFGKMRNMKLILAEGEEPREAQPYIGDLETIGKAAIYSGVLIAPPQADHSPEEAQDEHHGISEIDLEYSEQIERITLVKGKRQIVIETGNMMPPFQALNVCSSDLIRAWGLDPEQHKSYIKKPDWINETAIAKRIAKKYPSKALRAGESGIIRMRVTVEPDGSVSECHLQYATQVDHLESPACREMRSAKFDPALDSDGKPMQSYYMTSIIYSTN